VARAAIAISAFDMRAVIECHVAILGHERESFRGFLFLGEDSESNQAHGNKTIEESAHKKNVAIMDRGCQASLDFA
jgi:hypothetical protein